VPRREVSAREPGVGLTRVPSGQGARTRMSKALRTAVFATCALLWLSGAVWLVVHLTLEQPAPFGPLPSPWEPLLLKVHGLLAVVGVFLLGWITADHLRERRKQRRNYRSGVLLAGTAVLLALSGYALYYTTGTVHEVAARTHELLGVGSLLVALAHWWRARPRADSSP
jgi:uncharacterized membrane protein